MWSSLSKGLEIILGPLFFLCFLKDHNDNVFFFFEFQDSLYGLSFVNVTIKREWWDCTRTKALLNLYLLIPELLINKQMGKKKWTNKLVHE